MKRYYKYKTTNGQIIGLVTTNIDMTQAKSNHIEYVEYNEPYSIDTTLVYHDLDSNKIKNRPVIDCKNNISTTVRKAIKINNLPDNTKVFLDDNEIAIVDDGVLELVIPVDGTYVLKLIPEFPYIEKIINVEVK